MTKPRLTFPQMFNMSFGFLGIQFGWGLQLANMSAVYERLGARPDEVPLLWLAAPMTGLLVQPVVGALGRWLAGKPRLVQAGGQKPGGGVAGEHAASAVAAVRGGGQAGSGIAHWRRA